MDTFRKNYTPLTDEQKAEVANIKDEAETLETLFNTSLSQGADPRLIATAKTYLEITIMLAIKGATNDRSDTQTASVTSKQATTPDTTTEPTLTTPASEIKTIEPVLNTGDEPSPANQPPALPENQANENPPTPVSEQPPVLPENQLNENPPTPPAEQPPSPVTE